MTGGKHVKYRIYLKDYYSRQLVLHTVNILRLFFVKDKVEELALLRRAAGAIGGIGGAKTACDPFPFDNPFRPDVGSLFCKSMISFHEREREKLLAEHCFNNIFLKIFVFSVLIFACRGSMFGKEIKSLNVFDRHDLNLRSFILSHEYRY